MPLVRSIMVSLFSFMKPIRPHETIPPAPIYSTQVFYTLKTPYYQHENFMHRGIHPPKTPNDLMNTSHPRRSTFENDPLSHLMLGAVIDDLKEDVDKRKSGCLGRIGGK